MSVGEYLLERQMLRQVDRELDLEEARIDEQRRENTLTLLSLGATLVPIILPIVAPNISRLLGLRPDATPAEAEAINTRLPLGTVFRKAPQAANVEQVQEPRVTVYRVDKFPQTEAEIIILPKTKALGIVDVILACTDTSNPTQQQTDARNFAIGLRELFNDEPPPPPVPEDDNPPILVDGAPTNPQGDAPQSDTAQDFVPPIFKRMEPEAD
jgi:hypothetical protein